jgi:hypothetical protein
MGMFGFGSVGLYRDITRRPRFRWQCGLGQLPGAREAGSMGSRREW